MSKHSTTNTRQVSVYPLFERFWHWAQMLLIGLTCLVSFPLMAWGEAIGLDWEPEAAHALAG